MPGTSTFCGSREPDATTVSYTHLDVYKRQNVDDAVYIKIPTTEEGLKAMRALKAEGVHVTATAIYSKIQGFMAIACGADFIAPYYNLSLIHICKREKKSKQNPPYMTCKCRIGRIFFLYLIFHM